MYSDFRAPRLHKENANIGRHFRIGKEGKYDFYLRGEFVNIFNRTQMPNPIPPNPQNSPSKNNLGIYTAVFGVIPAYLGPNNGPLTNTAGFDGHVSKLGGSGHEDYSSVRRVLNDIPAPSILAS
ncbi:MAG: hypothetical protein JO307_01045 [Bryobacterales bacterium]|nr:hypothetical protein [Bryobacterales bacterium]